MASPYLRFVSRFLDTKHHVKTIYDNFVGKFRIFLTTVLDRPTRAQIDSKYFSIARGSDRVKRGLLGASGIMPDLAGLPPCDRLEHCFLLV